MSKHEPATPTDPASLRLDDFMPYRLNVAAYTISRGLARIYAARFDIGIPEWRVIAALGEFGSMTGKAIAAQAQMNKTKVSRALTVLARRGWVARRSNADDRREAFSMLTAEGRAIYEAIVPLALAFEAEIMDGVSAEDRAAFGRVIDHIVARVGPLPEDSA